MNYWLRHIYTLVYSKEFWLEYCFYFLYIAVLGFIVQIGMLDVSLHDYTAVLCLQICTIFASALIFVGLKKHYQPSNYRTKMIYFIVANGPRPGTIYHIIRGMNVHHIIIYMGLMLTVTAIEGYFYDTLFDRCCDWAYRLKTLYRKHKPKRQK